MDSFLFLPIYLKKGMNIKYYLSIFGLHIKLIYTKLVIKLIRIGIIRTEEVEKPIPGEPSAY